MRAVFLLFLLCIGSSFAWFSCSELKDKCDYFCSSNTTYPGGNQDCPRCFPHSAWTYCCHSLKLCDTDSRFILGPYSIEVNLENHPSKFSIKNDILTIESSRTGQISAFLIKCAKPHERVICSIDKRNGVYECNCPIYGLSHNATNIGVTKWDYTPIYGNLIAIIFICLLFSAIALLTLHSLYQLP